MRYVLIIANGARLFDPSAAAAGLHAALNSAATPALDAIGRLGKVGLARTRIGGADSFGRGALAVLGCDENEVRHLSDSALDAARDAQVTNADPASGPVSVLRVHLVSVSPDDADGLMIAPDVLTTSPSISHGDSVDRDAVRTDESAALLGDLIAHWRDEGLLADGARVVMPGPDGPHAPAGATLIVPHQPGDGQSFGPRFVDVELVDPSEIEGEPWIEHLPDGGRADDAEYLCRLITASRLCLADHPINTARSEQALDPINLAWFTDAGVLDELASPFPSEVICFTDSDFAEGGGLLHLLGLGATRVEPDAAVDAIARADAPIVLAMTHREIEAIDTDLIGPLIERLAGRHIAELDSLDDESWRLLFAISHNPFEEDGSADGMTPFALAGGRVRSIVERRLCDAPDSDLRVDPASDLLEYVLKSGLRGVI